MMMLRNEQKWSAKETKTNADMKKYVMSQDYQPPPKRAQQDFLSG